MVGGNSKQEALCQSVPDKRDSSERHKDTKLGEKTQSKTKKSHKETEARSSFSLLFVTPRLREVLWGNPDSTWLAEMDSECLDAAQSTTL